MYHDNTNHKKAYVTILVSDKANFRARKIISDKVGQYIIIKGPILREEIAVFNGYVTNNRVSKYETKNDGNSRSDRINHYYSWKFQHSSISD